MTLHTRVRFGLLITALAALVALPRAQQSAIPEAVRVARLDQIVPVDPLITVGTLPNGFRYYIRENRQPQAPRRASARRQGRLRARRRRPARSRALRRAHGLQRHAALPRPGRSAASCSRSACGSARTSTPTPSFDETVYELQIPTDNPAVIDRSLLILEDFAHNVSFDPEEIDKERGVVLEEWRLGLGADERIRDAQFPVLLKGSRYADRLPIGKPEIIRNVSHDRLKQFYTDWYRPDLMAVIVVGDFNKSAIEAQIKIPFRLDPGGLVSAAEAGLHRTGSAGDHVFGEHRPGSHHHAHRRDQHDAGTRADDDRRLPAAHGRTALRRDAVRAARRNRPGARTRRFCGRRPIARSSSHGGSDDRSTRSSPRVASSVG